MAPVRGVLFLAAARTKARKDQSVPSRLPAPPRARTGDGDGAGYSRLGTGPSAAKTTCRALPAALSPLASSSPSSVAAPALAASRCLGETSETPSSLHEAVPGN